MEEKSSVQYTTGHHWAHGNTEKPQTRPGIKPTAVFCCSNITYYWTVMPPKPKDKVGKHCINTQYDTPPTMLAIPHMKKTGWTHTAPVVTAEVGHNVFVLALLHHGDLLLDRCDVITWTDRQVSECFLSHWAGVGALGFRQLRENYRPVNTGFD